MSFVTNIIITAPLESDVSYIASINTFLFLMGENMFQLDPQHCVAGSKNLEVEIYLGAFNGLDVDAFIDHFVSLKWENAQLFFKRQHDDIFSQHDEIFS